MKPIRVIAAFIFMAVSSTAMSQSVNGSVVTAAQQTVPTSLRSGLNAAVNLTFSRIPLGEALNRISSAAGIELAYTSTIVPVERVVSLDAHNTSVLEALRKVLQGTGVEPSPAPGGRVVLSRANIRSGTQGVIAGKVSDSKTGKGIGGATVSVGNDARGTVTDEDGAYRLAGIAAGNHTVSVRLVGYAKQSRSVTVGEGTTITADFKLEPSANVLDQVIVTGTVVQTELKAVPNAITVITAKQIEERGITRIDQLFRGDVPGMFVPNFGSGRLLDSISIFSRGATSFQNVNPFPATTSIKTYIDGVEVANPSYITQLDPKSIERIEILTGPQASTIYGSNAINGVMQIFTKRSTSARLQGTLNLASGFVQNDFSSALTPQHDYSAQLNGTEAKLAYNVGGSWNYIGPWTPAKQTTRIAGYGGARAQYKHLTYDASLRYSLTQNKQTRADVDQLNTARMATGENTPSQNIGLVAPSIYSLNGRTTGLTVNYSPFERWTHELTVGSDMSDFEKLSWGQRNVGPTDTLFFLSRSHNSETSQRYSSIAKVSLSNMEISLTAGADHSRTSYSSVIANTAIITGSLTGVSLTRNMPVKNTGAFTQAQLGFHDVLFLTYGLRAEWNPNFGDDAQPNLAPRYGIAYTQSVGPVSTKLRASYGRSTRPPVRGQKEAKPYNVVNDPTTITLYGPFNTVLANPELGPEHQQGGEGGIDLYFGSRASLVITRYNQTVNKLIAGPVVDSVRSLLPNPPAGFYQSLGDDGYGYQKQTQNLNIGSIRNQGWELQGSVNTGPFTTKGTYSWTKSRVIGIEPKYRALLTGTNYRPGAPFKFLPEHTWGVNLAYNQKATTMSLNVNGLGFIYNQIDDLTTAVRSLKRLNADKPRVSVPPNYVAMSPGYTIADINAVHRFSPAVEGTFQIQNVADFYRNDAQSDYASIGRQTKIGVRMRF